MVTTDYVLTWMPFQAAIIFDDEHREILLSGAYGSAKTRTLCGRAVRKVQHPGARVCITRKTHTSLLSTTVRTLLEPDGDLPPVLPPGSYEYKEQKGRIFVYGGGEIALIGCDNHLRLGSEQFSDVLLDEGIETDEPEYVMLLGRLRVRYQQSDGKENVRTICTATNPGDPSHYLYKRFYMEDRADRLHIESNTLQNYYLPEDYRQSLNELQGVFRDRYYLGQWVAFSGAIYPMFDPEAHIKHDTGPFDYYVAGVDCGMKHPSVIRVHGCRAHSQRSHVVAEYHECGITSPEFVTVCIEAGKMYSPMTYVIDAAAADVAAQMREKGLHVVLAEKDVIPGIRGIQGDLLGTPLGGPLLTMEPSCQRGNAEYSLYRWKDEGEEPVKVKDDALDADRYARNYIRKGYYSMRALVTLGRRGGREQKPLSKPGYRKWDAERQRFVDVPPELDLNDDRLWDRGEQVGERSILTHI